MVLQTIMIKNAIQFLLLEKVHLKIWLMLSYIIYLGIQTYYIYNYNAGTTYIHSTYFQRYLLDCDGLFT